MMLASGDPDLPRLQGRIVRRGDTTYKDAAEQYASPCHRKDGSMQPSAIIYAKGDDDVVNTLMWARKNNIKVAVRTGGHQYSGASSTSGPNILLDLSEAYRNDIIWHDGETFAEVGVSLKLRELNKQLREKDAFVPHGQCTHVHVGGHVHTGGYGLPGRAFGLFGDHIQAIRVITPDGADGGCRGPRWIERNTQDQGEADLFWAVLGGSPGNFAVLTHIKLKVNHGKNHPLARGMSIAYIYHRDTLRELLQIKADMASDPNLPADFDMCITVKAPGDTVGDPAQILPGKDAPRSEKELPFWQYGFADEYKDFMQSEQGAHVRSKLEQHWSDAVDKPGAAGASTADRPAAASLDLRRFAPPAIIVFVEWANLEGAGQPYDPSWFDRIRRITKWRLLGQNHEWTPFTEPHGMPFMTSKWVYDIQREFRDMAYDKRLHATNATNLASSGWVDFTVLQIDKMMSTQYWIEGCRPVVQIQHYGGNNSHFRTGTPQGLDISKTSYSFRDTTMVMSTDVFYTKHVFLGRLPLDRVSEWQRKNEETYKGPQGIFSPGQDRRLLWGSYAIPGTDEGDMSKHWRLYHEDASKWERLCAIKGRVDPSNVLSPNKFSVQPIKA